MSWPDARLLRWDPTLRVTSDDGTRIAVEILGDTHPGPTVVLVHGWTFSSRSWHYQRDLAQRHRLVLMDHRGHGESDPGPREGRTIDQLGRDLHAVITATRDDRDVVLVGHSMGGMTIMALAERHPELVKTRVAGVAFVATSSGQMDRITLGLPGLAGSMSARFERRLAKALAHRKGERLPLSPAMVRSGARFLVFGDKPKRADVNSVVDQLLCAHPASLGEFQDAISVHDCRVALRALRTVPAVVLAGEKDRLCPLPHAKVIADELPDAEFVRYPGAGHMLPQERAAEVATRISALLRSVSAR
jgi:pimeloyl-ACP methyl ester carboxylesterase